MIQLQPPLYLDAGETALVVQFGTTIDEDLNDRVLELDVAMANDAPRGIVELVPTYRSLMIHYDPLILPRAALIEAVERALHRQTKVSRDRRLWTVPVCYNSVFADDIAHVALTTGMSQSDVIARHSGARYRVHMYGFAPGYAYLGGLPTTLNLARRTSPRDMIPAGSITIAGGQALIASVAMPSGWHILGRTPERVFAPQRDPIFLISVGDAITFENIDLERFHELNDRAERGEIVSRSQAVP